MQVANCLGRVTNIESNVASEWWTQVFADFMYLKTDGDVVEDEEVTLQEIRILESDLDVKSIFLSGSDKPVRILDLCCGQGRHLLQLAKMYPCLKLYGHDQSLYLISLADERAGALQETYENKPVFTVGDCRQLPYENGSFDFVMVMGNSFGYFKVDDGDRSVLEEIFRVLAPGGRLVLDLTDGEYLRENFVPRSWEWVDDNMFVCRERQLSQDKLRLSSREVITVTNQGVVRDQFYQERLYNRLEVNDLLQSVGFAVINSSSESAGRMTVAGELSKRQEDLGMMGHRMIVSASKPNQLPKITTVASASQNFPSPLFESLVLVLGDPSQPCVGKLNNVWNTEDLDTRQRLFDALEYLGYTVGNNLTVLDSHCNLHESLQSLPGNMKHFVFNLCDEGFNNDALKELHVPAILEINGIEYSGAGPNCLAYCYDKGLVNRSAEVIGVPTPREVFFFAKTWSSCVDNISKLNKLIEEEIKYPAFVKPVKGDNSLGITSRSIVNNIFELEFYVNELHGLDIHDVIIQEYCSGTEYGVGMIGNPATGFHFFPVLEVDFSQILGRDLAPILGFESKWDPSSPYWSEISYKPAKLSCKVKEELQSWCILLWERFGCRDYARFDFRCDFGRGDGFEAPNECRGIIKLLEVNPNPGWCWDGKFARMAKFEGKSYSEMLGMILNAAYERIEKSQKVVSTDIVS
ncbi:UNVERIFIED_CONTAM: hypothetical protein HDU68_003705 [Siphonaria sp. JEL0065]|nr:hypothetical protein HDU68_003705 [Siphonaria sp. JEL0065]